MKKQNTKVELENSIRTEEDVVERLIDNLTLFDDDLMSRVFERDIKATELVLSIVLGRPIQVVSVVGQDELKNPIVGGRNITVDIHSIDTDGQEMDIEVQGDSDGAHVKRARFHSSLMGSRMLKSNQKFKEMKDSYVIFIYKRDKFKKGLPVYHIERTISETGEMVGDGSHIIYVNGSYRGDDAIRKLIEDFHQSDADQMHYRELADGVRHFKNEKEGREDMCEAVQKYAKERELGANISAVSNLMKNMKVTLEQALNILGIQGEDRTAIKKQFQK